MDPGGNWGDRLYPLKSITKYFYCVFKSHLWTALHVDYILYFIKMTIFGLLYSMKINSSIYMYKY